MAATSGFSQVGNEVIFPWRIVNGPYGLNDVEQPTLPPHLTDTELLGMRLALTPPLLYCSRQQKEKFWNGYKITIILQTILVSRTNGVVAEENINYHIKK